jgi:hypothetical protein
MNDTFMRTIEGDIWQIHKLNKHNVWVCITTNGVVKSNGELVMGRGIAKECADMYPELPKLIGNWVTKIGNVPACLTEYGIITIPTKEHWRDKSSMDLINISCRHIASMIAGYYINKAQGEDIEGLARPVYFPPPGCGNGGLTLDEVRPILYKYFNDSRFTLVIRK